MAGGGARRTLALSLLLALAPAGCKGKGAQAEELATEGIQHGRAGRLAPALEAFDAALALDPKNLKALYNSGLALLGAGRGAASVERFERFLELRPDDALGHFHLARALLRDQKREEALEALQRAVEKGFSDWVEWEAAVDLEAGLAGDFRYMHMGLVVAQRAGVPGAEAQPGQGYTNIPMPKKGMPGGVEPRCLGERGQEIACAE